MHEMSLAEGVLQLIEDQAARQGFTRVVSVRLEIGQLAGVEVEAMRFCFDAVTRDSVAQGAALIIDEPAGRAWCLPCGHSVALPERGSACPDCGGWQLQPTGGTELRVKELEVE